MGRSCCATISCKAWTIKPLVHSYCAFPCAISSESYECAKARVQAAKLVEGWALESYLDSYHLRSQIEQPYRTKAIIVSHLRSPVASDPSKHLDPIKFPFQGKCNISIARRFDPHLSLTPTYVHENSRQSGPAYECHARFQHL